MRKPILIVGLVLVASVAVGIVYPMIASDNNFIMRTPTVTYLGD